jgi:glycosyltransferase involved in cell wall biosynthesis
MSGEPKRINIVEPTLSSEAGHCHSFLLSFCRGRGEGDPEIAVYASRDALLPELSGIGAHVIPYFDRRLRRLQSFLLYRKLLSATGRIFVSTAGRTDMVLLGWAASGAIPAGKVFLYFHWVRPSPGKAAFFRRFAARHPGVAVIAPTPSVAGVFRECGFPDVRVVPYPITRTMPHAPPPGGEFRHLLYAGAARRDKGFGRVVALVSSMAGQRFSIPFVVQASPDHYGKLDDEARQGISRLREASASWLRVVTETLEAGEYHALFRGGVCLQPYARDDFRDRVSGVTLDALSAACPVVVPEGTWMARVAERYGAGVAVADLSPSSLLEAARAVIAEYGRFSAGAAEAGMALQEEHDARRLYREVAEGIQ